MLIVAPVGSGFCARGWKEEQNPNHALSLRSQIPKASPKPIPASGTHCELGCLDAAQGGAFLHHETEEACQDCGHWPGWIPGIRVEIRDGKTQP